MREQSEGSLEEKKRGRKRCQEEIREENAPARIYVSLLLKEKRRYENMRMLRAKGELDSGSG